MVSYDMAYFFSLRKVFANLFGLGKTPMPEAIDIQEKNITFTSNKSQRPASKKNGYLQSIPAQFACPNTITLPSTGLNVLSPTSAAGVPNGISATSSHAGSMFHSFLTDPSISGL